jgi:septal ring factor EnvC (AmiA/AmiB activator)
VRLRQLLVILALGGLTAPLLVSVGAEARPLSEIQRELSEVERDQSQVERDQGEVERDHGEVQRELSAAREERAALDKRVESAIEELAELEAELAELEAEREAAEQEIERYQGEVDEITEAILVRIRETFKHGSSIDPMVVFLSSDDPDTALVKAENVQRVVAVEQI